MVNENPSRDSWGIRPAVEPSKDEVAETPQREPDEKSGSEISKLNLMNRPSTGGNKQRASDYALNFNNSNKDSKFVIVDKKRYNS